MGSLQQPPYQIRSVGSPLPLLALILNHLNSRFMRRLFYAPQAGEQPAGGSAPTTPVVMTVEQLIADNITRSAAAKAVTIDVVVSSISNWKPTSTGLAVVMVVTNVGNFWPLASSIKNCPKSFLTPVPAKAVVMPRADRNGVQRLNLSQLEFEGLSTNVALAIETMPAGTALFASAKDLK